MADAGLPRAANAAYRSVIGGLALAGGLLFVPVAQAAGAGASAPRAMPEGFGGTAYLKTRHTVLFDDKPHGLARMAGQALVDQCNGFRKSYDGLVAVAPPEAVMAALDVIEQEKFIAADKALTMDTGTSLVLTDMPRWLKAYQLTATNGSRPAVAPDCAAHQVVSIRHATLWRDGLVYELRFDAKKAMARRATAPRAPWRSAVGFESLPVETRMGQHCREVAGFADLPNSHACVWDLFPYQPYLNWPFAFSGRVQFGPRAGMFETIELLAVEHGLAIPAATFEIPQGFTVVAP